MYAVSDSVQRRLLLLIVLQVLPSHSITVNFERNVPNIVAKIKIPITPITVPCFLNDIVRLSATKINKYDQYYLTKPNGDVTRIKLEAPEEINKEPLTSNHLKYVSVNYIQKSDTMVERKANYFLFTEDQFDNALQRLDSHEFLLGPLLEEDFGNWVFSTYTKDLDDQWIEMFQVITMEIRSFTSLHPAKPRLNIGDTFNLSFSYPFPDITSCEIVAPRRTYDRFYDRSPTNLNKCSYTIPNISEEDRGVWQIIGVGRIIYDGEVTLEINNATNRNLTIGRRRRKKHDDI